MNRAERRRQERLSTFTPKTYTYTEDQLKAVIRESVGKEIQQAKIEAQEEAVNTAMILLLTLPLEVLMDHYWQKSYEKKIPKFTERVLEYYGKWQDGELDINKLKDDLWNYGGIRLEESEG